MLRHFRPAFSRTWIGLVLTVLALGSCAGNPAPVTSARATTEGPTPAVSTSSATAIASPTFEAAPSLSATPPDGRGQIAFFDDRSASGHQQIYIEGADGSAVRHVVTSGFDDQKPSLSPDGRSVLFTRYVPEGAPLNDAGVFIVNIDGTGLKQLDKIGEDVAWSPDATAIAETRDVADTAGHVYNVGLWVMKADGSGKHQVTLVGMRCSNVCAGGAQDNQATWSPDGKRIAFLRDTYTSPEQFAIFTIAADGTDLRRVTPIGMNVGDPDWSPDGSLIAFQSPPEANQGGEQNIYTIRPDGTGLTQLTAHLSSDSAGKQGTNQPSWSPDGTQIVFSHSPGMNGAADLFVMNRDGSDLHVLLATPLNENAPDWGPVPTR